MTNQLILKPLHLEIVETLYPCIHFRHFYGHSVTFFTMRSCLQDLQRSFTNKQESLESINGRGTSLVNECEDQLTRESGRSKLSDMNDTWSKCLEGLSDREDVLNEALKLAEHYEVVNLVYYRYHYLFT